MVWLAMLGASGALGCAFPDYDFPGGAVDTGGDRDTSIADIGGADASADASTEVSTDVFDSAGDVTDSSVDAFDSAIDVIDAPSDVDAGPVAPSCSSGKTGQNLCVTVPPHPGGAMVIDGAGDELCSVSALRFDSAASEWLEPDPLPGWASASRADIRLAWFVGATAATSGLHLHAFIADPIHHVVPTGKAHEGAGLTAYLAGFDTLTGAYDGVSADLGASAYVMPAPGYSSPDRVFVDYDGKQKGPASAGVVYATRLVASGYEVEAKIPWDELAPGKPLPASGTKIGLDFTLRVRDAGTAVVALLYRVPTTLTGSPCTSDILPHCDDRTWCKSKLGP